MVGLFYGLFTGEWVFSIGIALFYELFWLDAFPAGTFVPPHRILATFQTLILASALGFYSSGQVLPLLLPGVLLARIGARVESWQHRQQNASYNQLLKYSRQDSEKFQPGSLVKKGLLQLAAVNFLLYLLSFLACFYLVQYVYANWAWEFKGIAWQHIWSLGLLGAVLSLRNKIAYQFLALGAALLVWLV